MQVEKCHANYGKVHRSPEQAAKCQNYLLEKKQERRPAMIQANKTKQNKTVPVGDMSPIQQSCYLQMPCKVSESKKKPRQ